ncbi:MAG: nucleoside kinase [Acetivibrionales bacterium]|jgi:uridine kinase
MVENELKVNLNGNEMRVKKGTRVEDLIKGLKGKKDSIIVAVMVNNELRELTYRLENDCDITFVDLTSEDGIRIYERSLKFVLIKAVHDLFPDLEVQIRHSVSRGVFFEIIDYHVTKEDALRIEKRMCELIEMDIPFTKVIVSIDDARELFLKRGREDRHRVIENREKDYVSFYIFDDIEDYFYGYMLPGSGYLKLFALEADNGGLVLILPKKENPTVLPDVPIPRKLFNIFTEYGEWINILGVEDVGKLNSVIKKGGLKNLVLVAEALHEKKIAIIADQIKHQQPQKKLVMIAGPSSSGKTTFAQRLSIQLRVNGLTPHIISVDDYFVEKTNTPIDEDGKPDYEALEAIDLALFNSDLNRLIACEEVEIPHYNFKTGKREYVGRKMRICEGEVLIIEGIHCLNPRLTADVKQENKFNIYISAITSMRIDRHNRIPTTDLRLVRRMVRDNRSRGTTAPRTLGMWPSVRKGEEKNIFPFQEEADAMFNSSLIYDLPMLKPLAIPLLKDITKGMPEYAEARRLLEFLSYFVSAPTDLVPSNSILREFIGGSLFRG